MTTVEEKKHGQVTADVLADGSAPVLSVEGLGKHFGATIALRSASLDVRRGEIHALVG